MVVKVIGELAAIMVAEMEDGLLVTLWVAVAVVLLTFACRTEF